MYIKHVFQNGIPLIFPVPDFIDESDIKCPCQRGVFRSQQQELDPLDRLLQGESG